MSKTKATTGLSVQDHLRAAIEHLRGATLKVDDHAVGVIIAKASGDLQMLLKSRQEELDSWLAVQRGRENN